MYLFFLVVSFLASLAGAICGIGGGVIMKPVFDATGVMSVSAISFLSGCTVLAMSAVSIGTSAKNHELNVEMKRMLPMALGAAIGGVAGKIMFQQIKAGAPSENYVGFVQAIVLMIITLITLVYTIEKSKVKTLHLQNMGISACVGLMLGIFSSFLGIGGGPINLMVLSFCFSMGTKEAAVNSLFIILISQIFSLGQTLLTRTVPEVKLSYLILMVLGGILGGKAGHRVNKKIDEKYVNWLFEGLMVLIIGINIYNAYRFS